MAAGALVVDIDRRSVSGVKAFRKALKDIDAEWPKELRKVHKTIADEGARWGQGYARGLGGVQAKAAAAIKGRATQTEARIAISGGKSLAMAGAAFWGAKRHTGWYAAPRYRNSRRQHDPWVGNSWDVAVAGQGPYSINQALANHLPEILGHYGEMVQGLADRVADQ